jgi:hypothetical protein
MMWPMKTVILTLIGLCFFLAVSCGCPKSPPQPEQPTPGPPPISYSESAEQLAKRFCPIIHLKGEGGLIEHYEPTQIETLIDQSLVRDINNSSFQEKASISSLLRWSKSVYYLDLVGLTPSIEHYDDYLRSYVEIKNRYKPSVYARISEQIEDGYTVLQYWLFYYFNDWRDYHEGDWELVQLNFTGKTAKEIIEAGEEPLSAAYSQHQAGQQMSWGKMKETGLIEDTHPVVYVAQGSHSNYFAPGNFWAGLDFDDTGLLSWQTYQPEQLNIVLLPGPGATEEGFEWLDFKGYWGEYRNFSISLLDLRFWLCGPFGPSWKEGESNSGKWKQPLKWANNLPEYPKPFWTAFFNMLGDWAKLAVFSLFSPADLHVYDSQGRHIGLDEKGQLETQIPGAMYITPEGTDYKIILIPDADIANEYRMLAKGTEQGKMDIRLQIPDIQRKLQRYLEYLNVPISPKTVARAIIKPEIPGLMRVPSPVEMQAGTKRDTITKLEIDNNGDGIFEMESMPGMFIQQEATPIAPTEPDAAPTPKRSP